MWLLALPNSCFTSSFQGPIPAFSADNVWSEEREVTITKDQRGFGFSVKGFKPAIVGEVDKAGPAKVRVMSTCMSTQE